MSAITGERLGFADGEERVVRLGKSFKKNGQAEAFHSIRCKYTGDNSPNRNW